MDKRESFHLGVFYMLVSATGLALTGFFAKIAFGNFSIPALIFWRFSAALLFSATLFGLFGRLKGFRVTNWGLHLLRAGCVLGAQYCFYYYIEHDTLLNGVTLLNTGPFFIPFVERLILRQRIARSSWIGLLVSFLGVLCILQPNKSIFAGLFFIGLSAGVLQAFSQVFYGINVKRENYEWGILILFFHATIFSFFPYYFIQEPGMIGHEKLWIGVVWIVSLGIASILNQLFRGAAYLHGTPSSLSPFLYFSVLLAGALDAIYFGIVPDFLSFMGAVLVVLGGVLKIWLRYAWQQKK